MFSRQINTHNLTIVFQILNPQSSWSLSLGGSMVPVEVLFWRGFFNVFSKKAHIYFFSVFQKKGWKTTTPPYNGGMQKNKFRKNALFSVSSWIFWAKIDFESCLKNLKTTGKNLTTPLFTGKNGFWNLFENSKNDWKKCDDPLFSRQKWIMRFVSKLL